MSYWYLKGDRRDLSIVIGGPDEDILVLRGSGSVELDHGELRYKRADEGAIERIAKACQREADWELREGAESLREPLEDYAGLGLVDAGAPDRLIGKAGDRSSALLVIDESIRILLALPAIHFNRTYEIFSRILASSDQIAFSYVIRGEFDLGVDGLKDDRPPIEKFLAGAPLFSTWIDVSVYGRQLTVE